MATAICLEQPRPTATSMACAIEALATCDCSNTCYSWLVQFGSIAKHCVHCAWWLLGSGIRVPSAQGLLPRVVPHPAVEVLQELGSVLLGINVEVSVNFCGYIFQHTHQDDNCMCGEFNALACDSRDQW